MKQKNVIQKQEKIPNDRDDGISTQDFKNSHYKYVQGFKGQYEPNEEKMQSIRKGNQMQLLPLKTITSEMKISLNWINNKLRHCGIKEKHSDLEYILIVIIQTKA